MNSYCVCESFKSLTRSLSSCCIMRWCDNFGGRRSRSSCTILVVAPCLLSEKLSLPSSSMVQSLGGLWNGETVTRDCLCCQGKTQVLNFHAWILQRILSHWSNKSHSLLWYGCSHHTICIAKGIDGYEPCSHFLILLAHVLQWIWRAQGLSWSPTLQPKCNS